MFNASDFNCCINDALHVGVEGVTAEPEGVNDIGVVVVPAAPVVVPAAPVVVPPAPVVVPPAADAALAIDT